MFGARLRRRRGPPVLHRRAPPPRPRAALLVRRRRAGQPRARRASSGRSRRTPRPTCSARSTSSTTSTATAGAQLQADARQLRRGREQVHRRGQLDPTKMPGEYAAIGARRGPTTWKTTDLIATAAVVGAIFGKGGGRELAECSAAPARSGRFGAPDGPHALWRTSAPRGPRGARRPSTGSASRTRRRRRSRPGRRGAARPRARCKAVESRARRRPARRRRPAAGRHPGRRRHGPGGPPRRPAAAELGALPKAMSNALLVSARESASGHPLAVFGPQAGYFAPQILMEQDVHGAGHRRARRRLPRRQPLRAARPRPRLRLERHLGRPGHHRHLRGAAVRRRPALPLPRRSACRWRCSSARTPGRRTWPTRRRPAPRRCAPSAPSSGSSSAAARSRASRSPTRACAPPTCTRPTRPSASAMFNDPAQDARRPRTSSARRRKIGYTFNWFYADDQHIAYFNSGDNPVRAKGVDRPAADGADATSGRAATPTTTRRATRRRAAPAGRRPGRTSRAGTTSRPRGYAGADANCSARSFRSQLLDRQLEQRRRAGTR